VGAGGECDVGPSANTSEMSKVIYSMGVSLDGFIAGPDGAIAVPAPDEELHRFHNEQTRELVVHLCGRRLYEVLSYWDTAAERDPSLPDHMLEFAHIWKALPKVVFSRTLDEVGANATLATGDVAEVIAGLREKSGGDIGVGGAGLAATCIERGLIDEYRPVVHPVVAGGGTPFLPRLDERIALRLVETRTFGSGAEYLRYERAA
jgi:dihydrofolate reductase